MEAETVYSDYPLPRDLDRDRYAGKWVAIRGDDVVASAESLAALLENERVRRDDILHHVREPGVPFL